MNVGASTFSLAAGSPANGTVLYLFSNGTLLTGFTVGTGYFVVVNSGVSTFQLSATLGGTPITLTNAGSGAQLTTDPQPGDTISVGAGTFDVGTNQIFVPYGVNLSGSGIDITVILSEWDSSPPNVFGNASNSCSLRVPANATMSDFTYVVNQGGTSNEYGIGSNNADHDPTNGGSTSMANAAIERLQVFGCSDGFYGHGAGPVSITGCQFNTTWDTVVWSAAETLTIDSCSFQSIGPGTIQPGQADRVSNNSGGKIDISNSRISVLNTGPYSVLGVQTHIARCYGMLSLGSGASRWRFPAVGACRHPW